MIPDQTSGRSAAIVIETGLTGVTGVSWTLLGMAGEEITTGVVDTDDFDDSVATIRIDAEFMNPIEIREGRQLDIEIAAAGGVRYLTDYFVVGSNTPLAVMTNSFMTYPEALAMRGGFGLTLDAWDAQGDAATRQGALQDAYRRLLRLAYRLYLNTSMDYVGYGEDGVGNYLDGYRKILLSRIDKQTFERLPDDFRTALKRAQLIEANVVLGGDIVGSRRRDGVTMETIGESIVQFTDRPHLNMPVSREAFEELKRFVIFNVGLGRSR